MSALPRITEAGRSISVLQVRVPGTTSWLVSWMKCRSTTDRLVAVKSPVSMRQPLPANVSRQVW